MVMNPPFGSRLKGSWGDYKGGYKGLLLVYSRLARRVTLRLLFGLGYYKGTIRFAIRPSRKQKPETLLAG